MRIFRHPKALLVVLLLPLLVAGVGMWALKDRVDRLDAVPAAVVNLDEGVHMEVDGKDQLVPLGRSLAGALTQPGTAETEGMDTTGFDWRLTDQDDARKGLRDGTYAAVIVIPEDFSKDLSTLGKKNARQARIEVTTNDASGALDSAIGAVIAQAAASATGTEMTTRYLSELYVAFNSFHDSLDKAADGASELNDGADGLSGGLGQTSQGARKLAGGAESLAGGSRTLSSGIGSLSSGLRRSADGSQSFADGMDSLATGADGLATGNRRLATGLDRLGGGADQLADGAQELSDGINGTSDSPGLLSATQQLADGVRGSGTASDPGLVKGSKQLAEGAHETADGIRRTLKGGDGEQGLVDATDDLADGTEQYTQAVTSLSGDSGLGGTTDAMTARCQAFSAEDLAAVDGLRELCKDAATAQGQTAKLQEVAQGGPKLASGTRQVADATESASDQLITASAAIADGADEFAEQAPAIAKAVTSFTDGLEQLGDGAKQLSSGASQLADGVQQSASGADELADGAEKYAAGVTASASGAHELADGQTELAGGSEKLAGGADELADGADELADGTDQLADGTDQLTDGAQKLADGTEKFSDQLADGAKQAPTYTKDQRSSMSDVGAQPVTSLAKREHAADGAATAVFPFVMSLALWLGAFGTFLLLPALSRRFLDSAMPMWKVVLRSLWPAVAVGLVQAIAVLAVIAAIGVDPVSPLGVAVIAVGGAVAFAALQQMLLALLGNRVGRIVSLVVMVLQVVVLAGVLPLQTAPELLQSLSAFMPIAIVARGLMHAALGGALVSTSATCLALIAWLAASIAITLVASRRARSEGAAATVTESDALPA